MLEKLSVTCDRLLSQQQVACCHSHCAFPARGKDVLVYRIANRHSEVGHQYSCAFRICKYFSVVVLFFFCFFQFSNLLHIYNAGLCWSHIVFQPLQLTGHHGEVSALAFGQRIRPVVLCSASADYIIVWDIEQCQRKTQKGQKIVNLSQQPDL